MKPNFTVKAANHANAGWNVNALPLAGCGKPFRSVSTRFGAVFSRGPRDSRLIPAALSGMQLNCCLLALALVVIGGSSAPAATAENPYTPIVTRNIFGLVPIPVVDPASLVPVTPPPKITPNGIMTLFGKLQVLFKVAGVAAPGQPPKDESYVMGEGERENDIEVQKIDEKAAMITFNNHGTVQELALVVSKGPTGAPAPAVAPGVVPGANPRPAINPVLGGGPAAAIGFGGRFGRSRATPGGDNPGGGGAPGFGGGGTGTDAAGGPNNAEQLSPEAQVIMIEAKRMNYQQQGDPVSKIFPHTELTPIINEENAAQSSEQQ